MKRCPLLAAVPLVSVCALSLCAGMPSAGAAPPGEHREKAGPSAKGAAPVLLILESVSVPLCASCHAVMVARAAPAPAPKVILSEAEIPGHRKEAANLARPWRTSMLSPSAFASSASPPPRGFWP